ncbi:MAG TPA: hypothetical protein VJC21_05010 [Candidatus Nanoarchaeia archaeon]|nr:hypothetical protein [Candidatus Nanoarchaeia archaeon]
MGEEKTLYITPSIQQFLWANYFPREVPPRKGLLLAGKGDDEYWYANTGIAEGWFFAYEQQGNISGSLLEGYLQRQRTEVKIVPWMHHLNKEYDVGFEEFLQNSGVSTAKDLILLKPTAEKGKKHFVIDYFRRREQSFEPASLVVVPRINTVAERNIQQGIHDITKIIESAEKSLKIKN